ncbi:GNAT family N-acetyltransferase [Sulfitobacter sp. S190]|uniref:GNAT family N-acetyltransferase n=1 Tax=Sulfitobacter sp. S190 TaxID=2867022 RepID=UPI0021A4301A|nr:GNAT family N-acetyltransferase [Sulfitobacter sp. S190]UWR22862.1 GNAT family N-acetyltransferase [Sulfitobacter sp. S190]
MTPAPRIETDRLVLRGPVADDVDGIIAFYADPVRSVGFGGVMPRDQAWRWFASVIGHWHLRGYGFWTITLKGSDAPIGICGIWNPDGWPEPEIGWIVYPDFEGRGIAFEAATAVRAHAYDVMGFTTLTSNIVPGNTRSVALAERLGATLERTYDNINMGTEMLYRHPGPAELAQ